MSDNDLAAASAAAAEAIQNLPPEAPAPAQAPAPDPAQAPAADGAPAETFSREYVEELRQEAAKYRTRAKPYEEAFSNLSETERSGLLNLAQDLERNPDAALETLSRVQQNLQERTGRVAAETHATGEQEALLTPEQVQARIDQAFKQRDQEAQRQQRVQGVFAEAEALSPAYKEGSAALVQLLHVAQTNPEAGGTLAGAHYVLMGELAALQDQAVEEYRTSFSEPQRRPVQGGTPTTGKPVEPPKTLEEAAIRAREILGH